MRKFITKLLCFILFYTSYIISSSAIADGDTEQQKAYDSSALVPPQLKPPVKRGFVLVRGEVPRMQCNIAEQINDNCTFTASKRICPQGYQPEAFIAPIGNGFPGNPLCSLKSYVIQAPKIKSEFDRYHFEFAFAYAHFLNKQTFFNHVICSDQPISITYAIYCV